MNAMGASHSSGSRSSKSRGRWIALLAVAIVLIYTLRSSTRPALSNGPPRLPLRLAWGTFDPAREEIVPPLPAALVASSIRPQTPEPPGYHIVQFQGPIGTGELTLLQDQGADVLDYVPAFGLIVRMDAATAARVSRLPAVRWSGYLQPGFRLDPALTHAYVLGERRGSLDLLVTVFPGEDVAATADRLQTLGGTIHEITETAWQGTVHLTIDAGRLVAMAALREMMWIEPAPQYALHTDVAAGVIGARPVWDLHGLYGTGQIVGVCDTGLDQGLVDPAHLHDDFESGTGSSRVVALIDRIDDGTGPDDGATDRRSGHGTHVAGTILGNGSRSGSVPGSHLYPTSAYIGVAPEASLVFQAVENSATGALSGIPDDLNGLFHEAYDAGARLHSNSWGASLTTHGSYTAQSRDVDEFMWEHPDFLIIFSAGNEGTDANADGVVDLLSVTPPGTAKNCLTVGATENDRPTLSATWGGWWSADYPANPVRDDRIANAPQGLAAFSSRGLTLDGRTKPDVVAPGTYIAAPRSSLATSTGWGAINADYMYMGGTSMSAPLVTGAAALVRDFFVTHETYAPTAAMLKAALVRGATDLYPGQYGLGPTQEIAQTRPSPQAGWGQVNVAHTLFPAAPQRTWFWDIGTDWDGSYVPLNTGEAASYRFEVTAPGDLSLSLAWTDYPGSPVANGGLVNDLDLLLEGPDGMRVYPNHAHQNTGLYVAYDDGDAETAYTYFQPGGRFAVRFTPPNTPAELLEARLKLYYSSSASVPFGIRVFDDDGPVGNPGTLLCSIDTTLPEGTPGYRLAIVDLGPCSTADRTVEEGDVFIAFEQLQGGAPYLGIDTDPPIDARSWDYSGAWSQVMTDIDYMIGAVFAVPVTNQDRTNNVVGIDVPAAAPGTYTATVQGYNVPFGPQTYALALSGVARLLGTETVTRSIETPGVYKFGNTGATLEFAVEEIDAVRVTVYRDTIPGTGSPVDATRLAKRTYEMSSTGGSGAVAATLRLTYEEEELNGLPESSLMLYRWDDRAMQWERVTPHRYPITNTLVVDGVTTLSTWVIGGAEIPTAVSITGLRARADLVAIALALLGMAWTVGIRLRPIARSGKRALSSGLPQPPLPPDRSG